MVSGRWRLMCPPSACPDANTAPHDEHSCAGGRLADADAVGRRLSVVVTAAAAAAVVVPAAAASSLLWLVRWPPRAWKEGKLLLHVLHSYDTTTPLPAPSSAYLRLLLLLCRRRRRRRLGLGETTMAALQSGTDAVVIMSGSPSPSPSLCGGKSSRGVYRDR
ncbi:hypothetical protein U9M48_026070 [Paspalum notatum var. saurae]|uniref:Uncharacterized protein n=1 Tax=Paspalum notatum var. saurae TaxID=547442 RepID=A0AAQ3WYZ3_PASNO